MYLQITTRCNMKCSHCLFSCQPGVGEDMSLAVFTAGCELAKKHHIQGIALGGGEPTVHPLFWDFVEIGRKYADIHVITNGKKTEDALKIAKFAMTGKISSAALSQDAWHEAIDPCVVAEFQFAEGLRWYPLKHNTLSAVLSMGRGKEIGGSKRVICRYEDYRHGNCCRETFVTPDGCVFPCSCQKVKCGTVFDSHCLD